MQGHPSFHRGTTPRADGRSRRLALLSILSGIGLFVLSGQPVSARNHAHGSSGHHVSTSTAKAESTVSPEPEDQDADDTGVVRHHRDPDIDPDIDPDVSHKPKSTPTPTPAATPTPASKADPSGPATPTPSPVTTSASDPTPSHAPTSSQVASLTATTATTPVTGSALGFKAILGLLLVIAGVGLLLARRLTRGRL